MEKSVTTPDQYPLTLSALTNACNQKSSREPVLSLDPGLVQHAARQLEDGHLLTRKENFKSGVEKYAQCLCNTPFATYQFDPAEFALMCVLMLRDPQTPGELRTRSARLHAFEDNHAVRQTLQNLIDRGGGAIVVRLPRKPGRQDFEYAQLLSGAMESAPVDSAADVAPTERAPSHRAALETRVAALEQEVSALRAVVRRLES
jgi:uncharacterized protein YceH (UPF0502 family)